MTCPQCNGENPPESRFCAHCGASLQAKAWRASSYANFWLRFVAFTIDSFLLFIVYLALSVLKVAADVVQVSGGSAAPSFVASALILLTPGLYYWLFTGLKGQTIGKMALGIRVVDAQGNKPGLGRAALRESIGKTISTLVLMIGYLWVFWDKRKQGWHDKLAHTFVVTSS
ncbi:MAG: RDD family protein [Dehalococcoidia bacterium]